MRAWDIRIEEPLGFLYNANIIFLKIYYYNMCLDPTKEQCNAVELM